MNIQVCRDLSDAVALYLPQRLYLKSFAKLNISVQLPSNKVHGKSISNWELMEKLRKIILPDSFSVLKVTKHSSEMIRFDAELECREKLERVTSRLADRIVQLKDYPDQLKVRVSETKSTFPTRHDWDSFFRDATDMDEMKPGERPDTIHITNLPISWFVHEREQDEDALPSESIVKKAFEKFGGIRHVDVPAADPFRMQMKSVIRGITTAPQDAALYFEAYIQYNEYVSFVRCMDALRGRKILRKRGDIAEWCGIKVDFDKTKHMTDAAVKRRAIVRERLLTRKRARDEEEKVEKDKIAKREAKERQKHDRTEREKLEKMREREERRKKKQLAKLMERDNMDLNSKVAEEEKKLLKVQKKLQALRLIEELFKRIELRPELQQGSRTYYSPGDRTARARIVDKYKRQQEELLEAQRNQLKSSLNGRIVIRSALETKKPKRDSSISSASSDGHDSHQRIKTEKLSTPEREMEYNKATAGLYGMPYGFGYPFPCPPGYGYAPPPQTPLYYGPRGAYYGPPDAYSRRPFRARGRGRGRPRMPYFNGPDASHQYYKYFKKLSEAKSRTEHDTRSRSRSRSRRRSYSRSRSRSRSRRRSHSRSRSRRSRSRRSRSRRTRSRSRRTRSYESRSRSRSHRRSRSRSRHSRSRSRRHTPSPAAARSATRASPRPASPPAGPAQDRSSVDSPKATSPNKPRPRSRSWSAPKEGDETWSKSPKEN